MRASTHGATAIMERLDLPGWHIAYDRATTIAAHDRCPATGPEACGCEPCRKWASNRDQFLPAGFCQLLNTLGVPVHREAEVYHNCRLNSGLHSYGAWYHFVGRVVAGESPPSPPVVFGSFAVHFHSRPALLPEAFTGQPVVQLELAAELPWLSDAPEPH